MKTLGPVALGATCLGLQLISNPVEGFIATPAAGPGVQARRQQKLTSHLDAGVKSISLGRGAFVQHRRRASCGTTTCRMMMSGGFGRPAGDSGASGKASTKKGDGKGAAKEGSKAPAAGEEEQKGTGQRQLFMQFTCNRCEGVSQYMINKTAYEEGIVICTCQQCKVKHLIADNLKKMDFPAFGDNIEEYMQATGTPEEVTKGRAPDLTPEIVEKYDVAMGKDGVLSLSPKAGVDAVDDSPSSTA